MEVVVTATGVSPLVYVCVQRPVLRVQESAQVAGCESATLGTVGLSL